MPDAQHVPDALSVGVLLPFLAQQLPDTSITPDAQHAWLASRTPEAHVAVFTEHVGPPYVAAHAHAPFAHDPWPLQPLFWAASEQKEHGAQDSSGAGLASGHADDTSATGTGRPSA